MQLKKPLCKERSSLPTGAADNVAEELQTKLVDLHCDSRPILRQ